MTTASTVTASDGVTLAVHRYTEVDAARPTILAIHGWPDNHRVWDGVAGELDGRYPGRYNFVAYTCAAPANRPVPQTDPGTPLSSWCPISAR
jgi:pimeloyl-ACP methyl ester carboxylesterase